MKTATEAAREFLESEASQKTVEELKTLYGIELSTGSTNLDALNAVVLKKARDGDPKAIETAKKYGLTV